MKKILIITLLVFIFCGCGMGPEQEIDGLKKPVTIAGIGADGSVLLYGANGKSVWFPGNYYLAKAIREGRSVGDILIPEIAQ